MPKQQHRKHAIFSATLLRGAETIEIIPLPYEPQSKEVLPVIIEAIREQARFACAGTDAAPGSGPARNAKRILLDSIGCMAFGTSSLRRTGIETGASVIVGAGALYSRNAAVVANGTALVGAELDEGNQAAFGHPASHFVPALIAATCEAGPDSVSPSSFLSAFVAAYEIGCRWGRAAKLRAGVHPHGTSFAVGSAVAAGVLAGADEDLLAAAIALAASLPQPSAWASAFDGATIRDAQVGLANLTGFNALMLARMGVRSGETTLDEVWRKLIGDGLDEASLIEGLGSDYLIERNYFKVHSACRYTHGAADIVAELLAEGLGAENVKHIDVETYKNAAALSAKTPPNALAARFSIPATIALLLENGTLDPAEASDGLVQSDRIRNLAALIDVRESPEFTARLPATRTTRVRVATKDGRIIDRVKDGSEGDSTQPFDDERLRGKFRRLSAAAWTTDQADAVLSAIEGIDEANDLSELFGRLAATRA